MWETLEGGENTTFGTEVPGVGCIIAVPGVGMCFVPGTRLRSLSEPIGDTTHVITRDDRNAPPLVKGKTAAEILRTQPDVADPGALNYIVLDEEAAEY